jgi:hypothetical protein
LPRGFSFNLYRVWLHSVPIAFEVVMLYAGKS